MFLTLALLSLIWETGATVPAGRAYPAGFAGFFRTSPSWDWLPVAYGATASGTSRTNYWYDISANSWQTRTQGPTPARYDLAGTFAVRDGETQLFVFGGYTGSTWSNAAARYRYSTDAWTSITNLPYSAEGPMAAGTIGGYIYVMGGRNSSTVYNYNYRYDPVGDIYLNRTAIPQTKTEGACAIATNETGDSCVYLFTGIYDVDPDTWEPFYTNTCYEYRPSDNSWRARANFPGTPVNGASAATLRNEIYVMGGYNYWSGANPTIIYIYNPVANTWVSGAAHSPPVPNLPAGRDGGVATAPDFPLQGVRLLNPPNWANPVCNDTLRWQKGTGAVKIVFATGGDAANQVFTTTWCLRSVAQGYVLKVDTLQSFATAIIRWNNMDGPDIDDRDTTEAISGLGLVDGRWYYWTVGVVDEMPDTAWSQDTFRFFYTCAVGDDELGPDRPLELMAKGLSVGSVELTVLSGETKELSLEVYNPVGVLVEKRTVAVKRGQNALSVPVPSGGTYVVLLRDGDAVITRRVTVVR